MLSSDQERLVCVLLQSRASVPTNATTHVTSEHVHKYCRCPRTSRARSSRTQPPYKRRVAPHRPPSDAEPGDGGRFTSECPGFNRGAGA